MQTNCRKTLISTSIKIPKFFSWIFLSQGRRVSPRVAVYNYSKISIEIERVMCEKSHNQLDLWLYVILVASTNLVFLLYVIVLQNNRYPSMEMWKCLEENGWMTSLFIVFAAVLCGGPPWWRLLCKPFCYFVSLTFVLFQISEYDAKPTIYANLKNASTSTAEMHELFAFWHFWTCW
jgi:hypothetical protein